MRFLQRFCVLIGIVSVIAARANAQTQVSTVTSENGVKENFESFTTPQVYADIKKLAALTPQNFKSHPDFGKRFIGQRLQDSTQWYERLDKRTLKSRTYTDITDPTKVMVEYGYSNLNYLDDNGWLRSVDTKLSPAPTGWSAEQQETPTYLYTDAGTALSLGSKQVMVFNKNVRFNNATISTTNYTVGDDGMYIKNVAPNTDKIITFGRGRIETDYKINAPLKLNDNLVISEDIILPAGYTLSENKNYDDAGDSPGLLVVAGTDGKIVAEFRAPLCYDNKHSSVMGAYHIIPQAAGYRLEIVVPSSWITNPSRQYPITIDPIVTGPTSTYAGPVIPSCIYPAYGSDSIQVIIPADVTISNFYVSGNFYCSILDQLGDGELNFVTKCGSSGWIIDRNFGYTDYGPGNDKIPLQDFIRDSIKFSYCFQPACKPDTFYLSLEIARDTANPGSGCNTTYIDYDPTQTGIPATPFEAYIEGHTTETAQVNTVGGWSVSPDTVCSNFCNMTITVSTNYGVPPYTISHPWAGGTTITYGKYSTVSGRSVGDTSLFLGIPNCSGGPCSSTALIVPPPKITDACGDTVAGLKADTVFVRPAPSVIATVDTICLGDNVNISLSSCVAGTTFTWTGSDGSSGTKAVISDVPKATGTVTYRILPTSPAGCAGGGINIEQVVSSLPTATFKVLPATACVNGTVNAYYTGAIIPGAIYKWKSKNGTPDSINTINSFYALYYASAGTDTITLVVDANGCYSTIFKQVVNVIVGTPVSVSSKPDTICPGQSCTLTAQNATTYTWSPATGLSATSGSSVTASPTVTATYTVNGAASCSSTDSIVITVKPAGALNVQPVSPDVCGGQNITLYVSGGGNNFTWSPASGLSATTGDSVNARPGGTTTYTVTGKDSDGCSSTGTDVLTIIPAPNIPTITISVTGDSLISSAGSYNQWYFNNALLQDSTRKILIIKGHARGWYEVTVTNPANGCTAVSDSTTSVNPLSALSDQLSIYPNPFNTIVYIKISSAVPNVNEWSLQLTDVLGRVLFTKASLSYSNDIEVSNLPGGVYFIAIVNRNTRSVFPMVKQN